MSRRKRWTAWALAVSGIAALLASVVIWIGDNLERLLNRVIATPQPGVSADTRIFHHTHFVADLHCDSLLFGRNLLQRSAVGHIDLPRLQTGGVNLQVFAAATAIPVGFNINRTSSRAPDVLTLAAIAQRSGMARLSPFERALHHAQALHQFAAASNGKLRLIKSRTDLHAFMAARQSEPALVAGVLALEGVYPLDPDPDRIDALVDAGYRIIGLTHFMDNTFAGSAHSARKGGLTARGRELVCRCNELSLLLDLAHLSPRGIDDLLSLTTRPVIWSHGGVRGTVDNARNLADAQIRAIAAVDGVIGIGYWRTAVGGLSVHDVARAILHVVELVGSAHVALGSDFDGGIRTGFDTTALPAITQVLRAAGLDDAAVRAILGGNALRVLDATLPSAEVIGSPPA